MMGHMFGNYSGNWDSMPEGMYQYGNLYGLGHFVFCVLVIALLVSLIRYFWKLGDKVK